MLRGPGTFVVLTLFAACRTYDTVYTDDAGDACVAPRFPCDGLCIDPTTDRDNCGGCGNTCQANELCTASRCIACPGAELACGTTGATFCDDVSKDDQNCGACGNVCAHGSTCSKSACVCALTTCGSDCVDTSNDAAHCGSCSNACSTTGDHEIALCTSGQCGVACAAPWADCDHSGGNGCEANLESGSASCGVCGRACAGGGACTLGECAVTTYQSGQSLGALAVSAGFVYWADHSTTSGGVRSAPIAGGASQILAGDDVATRVAVDATRIAWLHLNDEIDTQLLSGGSPTIVASTPSIRAIALSAGVVFYATSAGSIFSVPADGSGGSTTMATGVVANELVADATDLYFMTNAGAIDSLPVGAQNATPTLVANASATTLTIDATHVYWVDTGGEVVSQPKGGTQSTKLATGQQVVSTLATDGVSLYWATGGSDVVRMPVTGGATFTLATAQSPQIEWVAVDSTRVFWTSPTVVASTTK